MYTIGQTAVQAGYTPDAIRYYEREGVLPAAERVGAGRYRLFSDGDVERVHFL